jgi:hypothetical protein
MREANGVGVRALRWPPSKARQQIAITGPAPDAGPYADSLWPPFLSFCPNAHLRTPTAPFCRTSAYALPLDKVKANKMAMFEACKGAR